MRLDQVAQTDLGTTSPSLDELLDRAPLIFTPNTQISTVITALTKQYEQHDRQTSSCVLIVKAARPIGILTERDIIRFLSTGIQFAETTIAEMMTQPLITLTYHSALTLNVALDLLQQHSIRHLPIVDEQEHLLGVITRDRLERQLLNAALQQSQQKLNTAYQGLEKQTAIAVQQSEAKFRHFAENSHAVIWIAQPKSLESFYVSPAYEKIWGRTRQSLIEKPDAWLDAIHPDDREFVQHKIEQQRQGEYSDVEYRIVRPDGTIRWIWDLGFPIWNEAGEIESFGGIAEDITERKEAELQLREMSVALSNAVEGISRLDPQGYYVSVNEAYANMVGYTPEEMIGMDWRKTVHPDDLEAMDVAYQHMIKTGKVEVEARGIRKDGTVFAKQLFMISAYDEQQHFIGHHCFMKDMTERKRLEAEKKQLEAQFLRAQRLESIGTLASGIAHDLNNILTPVLAAAQLLPRKLPPVDDSTQRLLEILEINAKRGGALVQQVLAFARGNDGQRNPMQVRHLLAEVGKIAQHTFPKSIQVKTQIPTQGLWLVQADTTQLHQVIMNLCVNARDAMPNGGILTLAAENCTIDESFARLHLEAQVGNYLKMTISDTGTGIAPEILDRIFDPFFTTKAQGQGTGLGLSTVLTIIKNHDGFLTVESEVRHGTSFNVYLPALAQGKEVSLVPLKTLEGHGELILVVDDEQDIGETVKATLEAHHYQVLAAQSGIEAMALYAKHYQAIDLVLLDLMMPAMDGFKLIATLPDFNPNVQIVAMSGLVTHRERVSESDRVQAFLAKPFIAETLLSTIAQVIQRSTHV